MRPVVRLLAAAAVLVAAAGARAAELPNMKAPPPPRARPCNIGGMVGVLAAGGVCVKIGGYVTGGVQMGNVKSPAAAPPATGAPP